MGIGESRRVEDEARAQLPDIQDPSGRGLAAAAGSLPQREGSRDSIRIEI
jgi:hypothetical protein